MKNDASPILNFSHPIKSKIWFSSQTCSKLEEKGVHIEGCHSHLICSPWAACEKKFPPMKTVVSARQTSIDINFIKHLYVLHAWFKSTYSYTHIQPQIEWKPVRRHEECGRISDPQTRIQLVKGWKKRSIILRESKKIRGREKYTIVHITYNYIRTQSCKCWSGISVKTIPIIFKYIVSFFFFFC